MSNRPISDPVEWPAESGLRPTVPAEPASRGRLDLYRLP